MERGSEYGDGGGGGGPSPRSSLEQRVAALETKIDHIESAIQRMEVRLTEIAAEIRQLPTMKDFAALKAEVAKIEGRLQNTPTTIQLFAFMITTWAAGAAIVFAVVRLSS